MPNLFVVATPIGNLEDVTLRALRILQEVNLIAAEDTRTTKRLLLRHGIKTPLVSYNEHNREKQIPRLINQMKKADVALVSDAGTPGIRDPGRELVTAAVKHGITVVPIPGPSVITTALSASGLHADEFLFIGYLPREGKKRRRLLSDLAGEPRTIVAFEAPHRIRASLRDLGAIFGEGKQIIVCRELTKIYEEIYRGTVDEATTHFAEPRGEFTLLIGGSSTVQKKDSAFPKQLIDELKQLKSSGVPARDAVGTILEKYRFSRRSVYTLWLDL